MDCDVTPTIVVDYSPFVSEFLAIGAGAAPIANGLTRVVSVLYEM